MFRRQYLLVPEDIDCPFLHKTIQVGESYTLYIHKDLVVSNLVSEGRQLILLGDMFDHEMPGKNNLDILKDLSGTGFEQFSESLAKYSGRFVIIRIDLSGILLFHDATASRKIFFGESKGKNWFGSQPYLLSLTMGLQETTNPSKLAYYQSDDFIRLNCSNIGETTLYDEISQLRPNHYLNLHTLEIRRYWPNQTTYFRPRKEIAIQLAEMFTGYMKSITNRYDIMLPVTAGKDSRMLLAATKGHSDSIYYYVNKDMSMHETHPDIRIPRKLLQDVGLEFHVHSLQPVEDEEFRSVYFQNNPYASEFFLPHVYNYYKEHSNKVNIPGNIVGRNFGKNYFNKRNITAESFAKYYGVNRYDHSIKSYNDWLEEAFPVCKRYRIDINTLFYLEERLFNWGGQIQLEKDIATEDYNLFNSRLIIEKFLSVKSRYATLPVQPLQRQIIKILWPELMNQPINPSQRNFYYRILYYLGLYWTIRRLKYRLTSNK
ncbi:MAG: hypothetical protein GY790_06105 [Bacteroidetes bacterium]|nr:hypothetical protein [Bacteroidota bacterium]